MVLNKNLTDWKISVLVSKLSLIFRSNYCRGKEQIVSLTGKDKRKLRAEGMHLDPEVWIGKESISDGTIRTLENSFATKELVKIRILENCGMDKKEIARILSEKTKSEQVQIIGRTLLLYRPLPEEKGEDYRK